MTLDKPLAHRGLLVVVVVAVIVVVEVYYKAQVTCTDSDAMRSIMDVAESTLDLDTMESMIKDLDVRGDVGADPAPGGSLEDCPSRVLVSGEVSQLVSELVSEFV